MRVGRIDKEALPHYLSGYGLRTLLRVTLTCLRKLASLTDADLLDMLLDGLDGEKEARRWLDRSYLEGLSAARWAKQDDPWDQRIAYAHGIFVTVLQHREMKEFLAAFNARRASPRQVRREWIAYGDTPWRKGGAA